MSQNIFVSKLILDTKTKSYSCVLRNNYYLIEIITLNHVIINKLFGILETIQLCANYLY